MWKILSTNEYDKDDGNEKDNRSLYDQRVCHNGNVCTDAAEKVYDETINPFEQIDQAVAKAKASGKYVICQVGGNWCPWCLRFADYISKDDTIMALINENFEYIHVNYHPGKARREENKEQAEKLMARLNYPGRFGFPVFVILDENGQVIHIQDSGLLEEGESYHKNKVMGFFANWTPKAVKNLK